MGDRIIASTPALAEAREQIDEVFRRNISPGGQWASLLDFSTRAAANASSDEKLYPAPELDDREKPEGPAARKENSPRAFFGKHAVTVRSVDEFLHVIATIQSNYSGRRLVWRGQQNAAWPVQSSLHRHIVEVEGGDGSEEHLVDYERRAFAVASQWGIPTTPAMSFLSLLQHNGAPTRLLDVSVDPNVASWFAVEPGPKLESGAAHIVVWAIRNPDPDLPTGDATPFWHEWESEDLRRKLDWGTGTSMWPGSHRRLVTTACGRNARGSSSEHQASSRRLSRTCTPSTSASALEHDRDRQRDVIPRRSRTLRPTPVGAFRDPRGSSPLRSVRHRSHPPELQAEAPPLPRADGRALNGDDLPGLDGSGEGPQVADHGVSGDANGNPLPLAFRQTTMLKASTGPDSGVVATHALRSWRITTEVVEDRHP